MGDPLCPLNILNDSCNLQILDYLIVIKKNIIYAQNTIIKNLDIPLSICKKSVCVCMCKCMHVCVNHPLCVIVLTARSLTSICSQVCMVLTNRQDITKILTCEFG